MLSILAANLITKANSGGLTTHQLALHMTPLLRSTITEVLIRHARARRMYVNFATNFGEPGCSLLLVSINSMVLFISYLSARKFASSTILTYFSALGYVHKLSNLPDLSKNFLVQKLLMAHIRLHPAPDVRLPITFSFAPPSACFKSHQFLFFSGCFTKQCFWWLSMAFFVCMNSRPRGQT